MTTRLKAGSGLLGFLRRHRHAEETIAESVGLNVLWTLLRGAGLFSAGVAAAAVVASQTSSPVYHPSFSLSTKGAAFITRNEGVRYSPYNDPYNCTWGVGHLRHMGPCTAAELQLRLTPTQATALLMHDSATAVSYVRQGVTRPINQAQFDALVDFAFNVGGGALLRSSALAAVNRGDYAHVQAALERWSYANGVYLPGLHTRRLAEAHLFFAGDYGPGIGRYVPPTSTPAPKPKLPKKTSAQLLRARTGYWSWLTWRLGEGAWRAYGAANPNARPHVPAAVPAVWWRRELAFLQARTKRA